MRPYYRFGYVLVGDLQGNILKGVAKQNIGNPDRARRVVVQIDSCYCSFKAKLHNNLLWFLAEPLFLVFPRLPRQQFPLDLFQILAVLPELGVGLVKVLHLVCVHSALAVLSLSWCRWRLIRRCFGDRVCSFFFGGSPSSLLVSGLAKKPSKKALALICPKNDLPSLIFFRSCFFFQYSFLSNMIYLLIPTVPSPVRRRPHGR